MKVIDADLHPILEGIEEFLPAAWRERWNSGSREPGSPGFYNPIGVNRRDAVLPDGRFIAHSPEAMSLGFMDRHGLDYAVLNPANGLFFSVAPHADYAAACCAAINDVVMQKWLPSDPRYLGSITISPTDPVQAAKEIRRAGANSRMVQTYMASISRMPYGQRYYWPIYEAASELNIPVAIHPGAENAGISFPVTGAGYPSTYLEHHTLLLCTYAGQLVSMVTEGVFQQFPKLKFVLIEGGVSWLPSLMWRLDKNWKALRKTAPWLDRPPSEIIAEHVRLTTQPIEEPPQREFLHQTLAMFPAEKMLMFSTDFPHWDGDEPDFAIRRIPAHMRDAISSGNARELYRLDEREKSWGKPAARSEVAPAPRTNFPHSTGRVTTSVVRRREGVDAAGASG